jgi:hypothetical protein
MQFLRLQRLTLGLIALLAVGWAQTFGLHRGWLCDCGGEEQITLMDHCHGPHSADCHEDEDHSVPHEHDEDDGDRHQHAAVIDSLVAKQQNDTALQLTVPVNLLSAFDLLETSRQAHTGVRFVTEKPPQRSLQAPAWPRRLAQTIALRI